VIADLRKAAHFWAIDLCEHEWPSAVELFNYSVENGSAKVCHGSGGIVLLRAE
jgi:hypothetical protein